MQFLKKSSCLVLCGLMLLSAGCARNTQTEPVKVQYYPACHEPLAYLHQRSHTGQAAARGAVSGGVISGIAAAIIGAIAGGIRPVGILTSVGVGAGIGGVAGGVSGAQTKEDNAHLAAYLEQIDGDISGLDIVGAAATVSLQCYNKEFQLLLQGMKDNSVNREAAKARFGEILAGRKEASELLKKPADSAELEKQFLQAEEEQKLVR